MGYVGPLTFTTGSGVEWEGEVRVEEEEGVTFLGVYNLEGDEVTTVNLTREQAAELREQL